MTKDFVYPVAERALQKWKSNNLDRVGESSDKSHYRFLFNGSTCNNGGTPFKAYLHVEVADAQSDQIIEKAWIEIPEDQQESAREMCGFRSSGNAFISSLANFPKLEGRTISEVLSEDIPLNHAGCFCTEPMVNQKWRMALSTIHYSIYGG